MKKILTVLFILAFVSVGFAFSKGQQEGMEGGGKEDVVIGVSLLSMHNEYCLVQAEGVEAAEKDLGIKVVLVDGELNIQKQNSQVDNFIVQKVDGIVLMPIDGDGASPAVVKAKEAGIPIVNVCTSTFEPPDLYVGSKDQEASEIAINYIADRIGGKGKLVMIQGPLGQSSEVDRTEGALDTLKNYPDIELVIYKPADWDREKAMRLAENWIQAYEGDIDAIFCQNDEMAMGALQAVEAAGLKDQIVVVGIDGIKDAKEAVKAGRLDATVFQDGYKQGYESVVAAYKLSKGEKLSEEYIPFQLVTKDNVDQFM
jgi:inositol transport system substrate-binding protein